MSAKEGPRSPALLGLNFKQFELSLRLEPVFDTVDAFGDILHRGSETQADVFIAAEW